MGSRPPSRDGGGWRGDREHNMADCDGERKQKQIVSYVLYYLNEHQSIYETVSFCRDFVIRCGKILCFINLFFCCRALASFG